MKVRDFQIPENCRDICSVPFRWNAPRSWELPRFQKTPPEIDQLICRIWQLDKAQACGILAYGFPRSDTFHQQNKPFYEDEGESFTNVSAYIYIYKLVGGFNPSENISQIGSSPQVE